MASTFVLNNDITCVLEPMIVKGKVVDLVRKPILGWVLNDAYEPTHVVTATDKQPVGGAVEYPWGCVDYQGQAFIDAEDFLDYMQRTLLS